MSAGGVQVYSLQSAMASLETVSNIHSVAVVVESATALVWQLAAFDLHQCIAKESRDRLVRAVTAIRQWRKERIDRLDKWTKNKRAALLNNFCQTKLVKQRELGTPVPPAENPVRAMRPLIPADSSTFGRVRVDFLVSNGPLSCGDNCECPGCLLAGKLKPTPLAHLESSTSGPTIRKVTNPHKDLTVGARVWHMKHCYGVVKECDLDNVREKPYLVQYESGEEHRYNKESAMKLVTVHAHPNARHSKLALYHHGSGARGVRTAFSWREPHRRYGASPPERNVLGEQASSRFDSASSLPSGSAEAASGLQANEHHANANRAEHVVPSKALVKKLGLLTPSGLSAYPIASLASGDNGSPPSSARKRATSILMNRAAQMSMTSMRWIETYDGRRFLNPSPPPLRVPCLQHRRHAIASFALEAESSKPSDHETIDHAREDASLEGTSSASQSRQVSAWMSLSALPFDTTEADIRSELTGLTVLAVAQATPTVQQRRDRQGPVAFVELVSESQRDLAIRFYQQVSSGRIKARPSSLVERNAVVPRKVGLVGPELPRLNHKLHAARAQSVEGFRGAARAISPDQRAAIRRAASAMGSSTPSRPMLALAARKPFEWKGYPEDLYNSSSQTQGTLPRQSPEDHWQALPQSEHRSEHCLSAPLLFDYQ